ncbi:MAG: matrixin family metalloprotease [Patescibacteria group bacterium]
MSKTKKVIVRAVLLGFIAVFTFTGLPFRWVKAATCWAAENAIAMNQSHPSSLLQSVARIALPLQAAAECMPNEIPADFTMNRTTLPNPNDPEDPINYCDPLKADARCPWFFWSQRRWATESSIHYSIKCNSIPGNLTQQQAINAITASFETWNSLTENKLHYIYDGCDNAAPAGWKEDGKNIVSFFSQDSVGLNKTFYSGALPLPVDEFGKAYLPNSEFDVILDSTLPDGKTWTVATEGASIPEYYDIQNIAVHEVGHTLGLSHPQETGYPQGGGAELTMYSSTNELGVTKRQSLGTGDVNGVKCIYTKPLGADCRVGFNTGVARR